MLESNEIASSVIADESTTVTDRYGESVTLWNGPLATKIQVTVRQRLDKFSWQSEIGGVRSDIEVLIAALRSPAGTRYSIQFVDISAAQRTAEAQQLALEKEQVATARLTELNRQKKNSSHRPAMNFAPPIPRWVSVREHGSPQKL